MNDLYPGILRMLENFNQDTPIDLKIQYILGNNDDLLKKYDLYTIAGNGDDFSKVVNLMEWESSHIYHKGDYDNHITNEAQYLFEYAYDKGAEHGINCRSLAIALAECLLAMNIKARVVYLMPFSPYDTDNHVACEVWIPSLNKWVMFDPTYNLYSMAEDGIPLSIIEIRQNLALEKNLIFNRKVNYNGNEIDTGDIIDYYAKDFFCFRIHEIQTKGSEERDGNRIIDIAPNGYDCKKCMLANIDYRIKLWGDNEAMQNWKDRVSKGNIIYKPLKLLYCKVL